MPEVEKQTHVDNATALEEIGSTLQGLASEMRKSPEAVSLESLQSLCDANETLTRILGILTEDTTESAEKHALDIYRQPCSALGFNQRVINILERAPMILMRNGLPIGCKKGFSTIGELVQADPMRMFELRNYGKLSERHLLEKLEAAQLKLGTTFTEQELDEIGVDSIRLDPMLFKYGKAIEYRDGSRIKLQEAISLLNTRVIFHPELSNEHKDRFTRVEVMTGSGRRRSLETFGDLIQVSKDTTGCSDIPIYVDEALNILLPKGLCFGMKLRDHQLQELQIERVSFVSYNYR